MVEVSFCAKQQNKMQHTHERDRLAGVWEDSCL
jgi:hypothetical protein